MERQPDATGIPHLQRALDFVTRIELVDAETCRKCAHREGAFGGPCHRRARKQLRG